MGDCTALRAFGTTAEKWRRLAEKRREHFRDLYRSGRWRLYYTEDQLIARLREVSQTCDRWGLIVDSWRAATVEPDESPDQPIEHRDAA